MNLPIVIYGTGATSREIWRELESIGSEVEAFCVDREYLKENKLLGLPVVLTIALRRGPKSYDIHLESIADGGVIRPKERPKAIQQQIELYAGWLEHYCLKAPYQWFNFYDFWAKVGNERR